MRTKNLFKAPFMILKKTTSIISILNKILEYNSDNSTGENQKLLVAKPARQFGHAMQI